MKQGEEISNDAINDFVAIVGIDFVKTDSGVIARYARSTLASGTSPSAVVLPKHTAEIQRIVKIAAQYHLQIHPVSTGKNWGYSDACAPRGGNVILDLSRMNTIVEVSEDMCYATIEPGVTQGQLYEYLHEKKIHLWMDATGAGPDTSIIGNVLERGFGHSPHGDRFAHSCAYEIVLPSGEILNTGFAHHKNSRVSEVYKWGVGPSLDGLFTQSNFGIVTKMTIWLLPKPEDFRMVFFVLKEEDDIARFIDKARGLRIDGTIRSVVHISNDLRSISSFQRFPFDEVSGAQHLSKQKRGELTKKYGLGFWVGSMGFYGTKEQNRADIKRVKSMLGDNVGLARFIVVDEHFLKLFDLLIPIVRVFPKRKNSILLYKKIKIAFELLRGKSPNGIALGGLWKSRKVLSGEQYVSADPLDHDAGFYWISPILPMRGGEIKKLTELMEPVFNKYGFDFLETLSMVSGRALCAVMTICFDKNNTSESSRAKQCHDESVRLLLEHGYVLYRAGNQSMKLLDDDSDTFMQLLKKIKQSIDPLGIISPGKYIPD